MHSYSNPGEAAIADVFSFIDQIRKPALGEVKSLHWSLYLMTPELEILPLCTKWLLSINTGLLNLLWTFGVG